MSYSKQQLAWRAEGKCMRCGKPLDGEQGKRYTNCLKCRTEFRADYKALTPNEIWAHKKAAMEARRALEEEKRKLKLGKCAQCVWSKQEGAVLFCPFMEGICMRGAMRNERSNREVAAAGD